MSKQRDKHGRYLPGHKGEGGRPAGIKELRPRASSRRVVIVTAEKLSPATLDKIDKRSGPGRVISKRRQELLAALHRPATPIEASAVQQVAYLEFRLACMEGQELLQGSLDLQPILAAQRELRSWYGFLQLRIEDQRPRSLEDWLKESAQDAPEDEGLTDDATSEEIGAPEGTAEVEA